MKSIATAFCCTLLAITACSKKAELNRELIAAVSRGDAAGVHKLLSRGADANARDETNPGRSALGITAEEDNLEIASLLITRGADVNARSNDGLTALMCAAGEGNAEMVKLLLAKGAKINLVDSSGQTSLIKAAADGHDAVVTLLIARGADVDLRDDAGHTAIMKARINGHMEMARQLQLGGARLSEDDLARIMEAARMNAEGEEINDIDDK